MAGAREESFGITWSFIRNHMVMPFILGDFYPGHSEEVAGGK